MPDMPAYLNAIVGWAHEYRDVSAVATTSSLALGSAAFTAPSASVARNLARVGAGIDVKVASSVQLYASYDAGLSRTTTAQTLTAGLRVAW
jgi:outer membrane autotransporter protein